MVKNLRDSAHFLPDLLLCSATQSAQWYAWGPPNMQCRLCASCWIYWKKYGGLKTPTQLEGAARGTTVRIEGVQAKARVCTFHMVMA